LSNVTFLILLYLAQGYQIVTSPGFSLTLDAGVSGEKVEALTALSVPLAPSLEIISLCLSKLALHIFVPPILFTHFPSL
jgi:hypothetical protein